MWCHLLPELWNKPGQLFVPPQTSPPMLAFLPYSRTVLAQVMSERAHRLERAPFGPATSPTTFNWMLICIRAWPGSPGLPSPGFSHPTSSRTGRGSLKEEACAWLWGASRTRRRSCDADCCLRYGLRWPDSDTVGTRTACRPSTLPVPLPPARTSRLWLCIGYSADWFPRG